MATEALNACLRGELSAIETYRQALEKIRGEHGSDPRFARLTAMLDDHQRAAGRLRELVVKAGGTPSEDSGAWGTWAKTVMGAAKLLGDAPALKALKEGEEDGVKQYERLEQESSSMPEARDTASTCKMRNQAHIQELDTMIQGG